MTQPKQDQPLKFPKRFLWGAASSSHQYEGGADSQWTAWEDENAQSLATKSSYQYDDLLSWSSAKLRAMNPENYLSREGNGHHELWKQDFKLLELMNLNAWRFSIEWARIEPIEGQWDEEAIKWYEEYIRELQARDIEPIVTLFHFTLPKWFSDRGGFEGKKNNQYFERYATKMIAMLSKLRVRYIITINEPAVYISMSYVNGEWPPAKRKALSALKVHRNMTRSHKAIYQFACAKDRRLKLAIAKNSSLYQPKNDELKTKLTTKALQFIQDDFFLRRYAKHSDFIGVNYYFSNLVDGWKVKNTNQNVSDLGWDMQPRNLQLVLERLSKKYKKPLFVTENGVADGDDQYRKWWLEETIIAMNAAMKNDVQLIGYLHWSLLDNFEWDKGFWPKFGLVEVDYETMKRKPRKSAVWYGKVVKKLRRL